MNKKRLKITLTSLVSCFLLGLSSCGGDTPAHVHTFSSEWTSDETYHWHSATCGHDVVSDKDFHSWGEWVIDIPATIEKDGTRHHVCGTCSYSHSETYKYKTVKAAERVYVSNAVNELFNGYTYKINPVVVPYDANKNVKYVVENADIISISNDVALAKGVGNTLVYVYNDEDNDSVRDDNEAFTVISFIITNPDPNKYVTVQDSVTVRVDETKKLTYSSTGIEAFGMEWGYYTDDPSICTISEGIVKGHKPGTTRISVSLKDYRAYCNVTVEAFSDNTGVRAYEIDVEDDFVLNKGETKSIAYNILPSESVDTLASVVSNNESIVKVNSDMSVTAVKGGSARIKLTTSNGKYTFVLVTVKDNANITDSYYNNYYGNLTWTDSEDLINKLHSIISKNVTPLKYNTPNWETNQMADQALDDHSYVDAVYIDNNLLKTNTNTGWQREHAFAASLMTGYSSGSAVTSLGRATDFHNLFAAGGGANGSRNNKNLGYARVGSQEITTKENCVYDKKTFEPADEDKGRLARALMYMTVMYNGTNSATITESSKSITYNQQSVELTNENVDYNKIKLTDFMSPSSSLEPIVNYYNSLVQSESPSLSPTSEAFKLEAFKKYMENSMPYAIGNASDIFEWNSFPVNHIEYQHNNSVYSDYSASGKGTQGNRNPFVDYPELVEYVFGGLKDEPGSLTMLTPTYLALEMDKDEIHHYAVESEKIKTFESGSKPSVDDFDIKAIKNNLSQGTLDKSKISVEDYTFTDDDVLSGKVITITTDKNTLYVPCKVTSDSVITFDNCKFSYKPTDGNKSDYSGSGTSYVATFSGQQFDMTLGNATTYFQNRNAKSNPDSPGVTIGSNNSAISSFTLESKSTYTNVNAIFFYALTNKDVSIPYKLYVNDTEVYSGTVLSNVPTYYGGTFNEISGKIKIVLQPLNAFSFCGIAFNYE